MITVNILADRIPIGGRTTGEVSAMYPTLVTPAAYAFSIWGLIYLLLAGYVIVQALPRWRYDRQLQQVAPWFILQCVLNSIWIICWHDLKLGTSVWIMLALLITLIIIYIQTRQIGRGNVDGRVWIWGRLPFQVYLGWICVATIVNISVALTAYQWNGWGIPDSVWAALVLLLATVLAFAFLHLYQDMAFALVIVWALIAIGVNQWGEEPVISWIAWGLSLLVIIRVLMILLHKLRR